MPRAVRIPDEVTPTTPLRLDVAVQLAFPPGSGMTAASLRREAGRGRLVIERIAGKDFVTLSAIEDMRQRCRVTPKEPGSGSSRKGSPRTGPYASNPFGLSETEQEKLALAALEKTAKALKERSKRT